MQELIKLDREKQTITELIIQTKYEIDLFKQYGFTKELNNTDKTRKLGTICKLIPTDTYNFSNNIK